MADFPQYPATSFDQAVDLTIFSGNQLADVINGDATQSVATESGDIPTLRKALVDNFFFKNPIPWTQGQQATIFNQLYYFFSSTSNNGWYYAPSATSTNPVLMGATPVGDANWRLYSVISQNTPAEVFPWGTEILTTTTTVSPPHDFDTAIVTFNGITLTDRDYTVNNSVITFTTPLIPEADAEEPDYLFCYLGRVQQGNPATNYVTYQALATTGSTPGADLVGTKTGNTLQQTLDSQRGSFQDGVTLIGSNDQILDKSVTPNQAYRWAGTLPKVVPANSTPTSTGGIGVSTWVLIADASLRSNLLIGSGDKIVKHNNSTVYEVLETLGGNFEYYQSFGKHLTSLHGGGKSLGAENSLITATLLAKRNAVIDLDISTTSDSVPILLHNATVDGITSGSGSVFSLTLAQIKSQRVLAFDNTPYAGTPLTTWAEMLVACSRRGNLVTAELKNTQNDVSLNNIYQAIVDSNMQGRVMLQCLNIVRLNDYRNRTGDLNTRLSLLIYDGMPNSDLVAVVDQVRAIPKCGLNVDIAYTRLSEAMSLARQYGLVISLFTATDKTQEMINRGLMPNIQITQDFTE